MFCHRGCPTIDIAVPASSPALRSTRSPLGVEGRVELDAAGSPADILIFLTDGQICGLEYVFYGGEIPLSWPSTEDIAIVRVG